MAELIAARTAVETRVPAPAFHLPKGQIALFVRELASRTGDVVLAGTSGGTGRVSMRAGERRLLDDVARLLLRFGISARVLGTAETGWRLDIAGTDSVRRFLQEIGVHGHEDAAAELLRRVKTVGRSQLTEPRPIWAEVRDVLATRSVSSGTDSDAHALQTIARVLDEDGLEIEAVNDLLWEEVVAIEPLGEKQVFDATVLDTHNFIANGIAVHNSIEQDADMVILLHREDAYEKESPRAGEADLIVAKHRNGPTDTITVAFQGHYSRFVDMQS